MCGYQIVSCSRKWARILKNSDAGKTDDDSFLLEDKKNHLINEIKYEIKQWNMGWN